MSELTYSMMTLDVDCGCCCDEPEDDEFDVLDIECDCECECCESPEEEDPSTTFQEVYDFFLAGITDDMFMELTREDTLAMLEEILLASLPHFEFPHHKDFFNLDMVNKKFRCVLTVEEKLIIRHYMISEWIGYQLASIENIRQKYSGSDFKFTSQASHIDKLTKLRQHYIDRGFHLQRVYCRRRPGQEVDGYVSTMDFIMQKPKR